MDRAEDDHPEISDEAWCGQARIQVIDYLNHQDGLVHGAIGDWPAWHIAPYVSLWAVESPASPGSVGWWVINGDLPTDYCSAQGARHPKLALERIAGSWLDAIRATREQDEEIGETGLSVSLIPLLQARAAMLLEIAADDQNWQD